MTIQFLKNNYFYAKYFKFYFYLLLGDRKQLLTLKAFANMDNPFLNYLYLLHLLVLLSTANIDATGTIIHFWVYKL